MRNGLLIGGALYLSVPLVLYAFQRQLIFQGTPLDKAHKFSLNKPFDEVWLRGAGGPKLHGIHVKTTQPTRGVVYFLHGNAGNLDRWIGYHRPFTERGYDVFAIDYRGYGKSEGRPSAEGLFEDARTGYEWLRAKFPEEKMMKNAKNSTAEKMRLP